MKIFFLRHQAAGLVTSSPFDHVPSASEIAPLLAKIESDHGSVSKKTGAPFWWRVESAEGGNVEVVAGSDIDATADWTGGCSIRTETGVADPKTGELRNPEAIEFDAFMEKLEAAGIAPPAGLTVKFGAHGRGTVTNPAR